ncbi:MAG: bifunctional 4-hydroxy-2-oxoglutarate aldolase/2-dehydro-3-deoxy-phosphogluconate aldolase [Oscillospiraceae bacterium]|jgi:2-dehydro-3-deoxyphosphogluconate aldolase/(4S)-4-hydroxy-2-oxoglutarate aldolase|nr:bifunctional 4-hydroxy-2-oxoglutarate aldolase/2-dehydro-3-deoxy-phosphogluconate aldolase [Oscillospiraceae bacterium]
MDLLPVLERYGLIPAVKVNDAADAAPIGEALIRGGLPVAEFTFRTPAAEEAIRRAAQALPELVLGAGTVLSVDQAERAVKAGAKYIVAPGFNPKVVGWCVEHEVTVLPGVASGSEIESAMEMGIKAVKFFPAEQLGGLAAIKALSGPYFEMKFVPTGGVSEKNLAEYLSCPKVMACGGSWFTKEEYVAAKAWDKVEAAARAAVAITMGFEVTHVGVNADDGDDALAIARRFGDLFGWPLKDGGASAFSGSGIEVMKGGGRGAKGHISVGVNSLARAKAYLEAKGVVFAPAIPGSKAAYIEEEIGGFAVHLLQK